MRSACWGAMSARSLITMRPLVVSITIAFALSRLAGSGWAIAGPAQISAATKARMRIMETPGSREVRRKKRASALAGEFGLEFGGDRGRHECGEVAAHGGDLAYQCGGDRADGGRRWYEHRMHLGRHGLVHAGYLHLVVEIGAVAQPPDHDGGAGGACRGDGQIVIGGGLEGATGLLGDGRTYRLEHLQPFLGRKQRLFARIDRHSDDQAIAQRHGMLDHVQMAEGYGVKRAGIKSDTGHRTLVPRPGRAGKPEQAGLWPPPVPRRSRFLFAIRQ